LERIRIEDIANRQLDVLLDREQEIDDLAHSFSSHGQMHPIFVRTHPNRKGKYEVVAGARRLAAAKRLGWETISAEIVDASDCDALVMALIENEHRKDFVDYERALLLERLHVLTKRNYSSIAELIGKSNAYVSQHIAMLHLFPESVSTEEERRRVLYNLTEGHARSLLKIEDPIERWNTAKLVVKANLGTRELEKMCRKICFTKPEDQDNKMDESVEHIVRDVITGLNSRDLRPLFDARSIKGFTFFSSFPPFDILEREAANDHVFKVISHIERFRVRLKRLQVVHRKDVQVAILELQYEAEISGKVLTSPTRATLVFFREGNNWKIVHEHWSSGNASPVDPIRQATMATLYKINGGCSI
jgi:ParB family chromosome partitioning protein